MIRRRPARATHSPGRFGAASPPVARQLPPAPQPPLWYGVWRASNQCGWGVLWRRSGGIEGGLTETPPRVCPPKRSSGDRSNALPNAPTRPCGGVRPAPIEAAAPAWSRRSVGARFGRGVLATLGAGAVFCGGRGSSDPCCDRDRSASNGRRSRVPACRAARSPQRASTGLDMEDLWTRKKSTRRQSKGNNQHVSTLVVALLSRSFLNHLYRAPSGPPSTHTPPRR